MVLELIIDKYQIRINTVKGLALPSAPMDTNFTPLQAIKSRALLTLAIL